MRTLTTILQEIRNAYITSPELINAYQFDPTKSFEEQVSPVSIESISTYITAYAIWTLEKIMNAFSSEIDSRIGAAYLMSERWVHDAALSFQLGDILTFDPINYKVGYLTIDASKQIVKYAAVKTIVPIVDTQRTKLGIKISKANKEPLTADELSDFRVFMNRKGAAGISYEISSGAPLPIAFNMVIVRDPLTLKDNENGRESINNALRYYLDNLEYGGEISTAGIIKAVLSVTGVQDIRYNHAVIGGSNHDEVQLESNTGAFTLDVDNMQIVML